MMEILGVVGIATVTVKNNTDELYERLKAIAETNRLSFQFGGRLPAAHAILQLQSLLPQTQSI